MDKIKNLISGRISEWKDKEEKLELELRGKKHCIKRNKKKFHLPDNENAGLSQAKHLQLLYENQRVNVVLGNKRCLSW